MKPTDRQQRIVGRLRALHQEWGVEDLAKELGVSALTIRRDLDVLARDGAVIRTLGGCMAAGRVQNTAYQTRVATNFEAKQAIGRAAAAEIQPGSVTIINDGSTTFHLASCLGDRGKITVYTNSIAMIAELSRFPEVRVYVLGGEYHADLFYLGGSLMDRVLETVDADTVFLGTDSVDPDGRCLVVDQDVARTTQMMLRRGRRKILLADATKVTAQGSAVYGTLADFDLWITSRLPDRDVYKQLRKHTEIREVKHEKGQ